MKKIIGMLVLLFVVDITVMGCQQSNETKLDVSPKPQIKYTSFNVGPEILTEFEYEGHRYLSSYHGGIVHAESCPCKRGQLF